ncbi:MAG TPA: DUF5996 family protein [Bryobacteraceae bacterium]|nr:DUF5996 family protein [Bryobacteraceae bacterium]
MTQSDSPWLALPLEAWQDTYQTLQLWTQVAGKIRMTLSPELNHWWQVALYVNSRGLTTSTIPFGTDVFEIQFDFLEHQLEIRTSQGGRKTMPLVAEPVAVFYSKVMEMLRGLGITVVINTQPQELANAVPFEKDFQHASYDREYAYRFWRILLSTSMVLQEFRSRFIGKCSPVHFFWGAMDLACTRFSGRVALPPRKGAITGPGYSHEVISAGFWPGAGLGTPAFYAYAAPSPAGLEKEAIRPAAAAWNPQLSEFILKYDDVRGSESPRDALLDFFESTYAAAATLANWDRGALESPGAAGQGSQSSG